MAPLVLLSAYLLLISSPAQGANILGLMGVPSPSHHNWNRHIFYKLASRGHNLTVLSADVDQEVTPGVHYVWAEKVYSMLYNGSDDNAIMAMVGLNPFQEIVGIYDWFTASCEGFFQSEGFKVIMRYPETFKFDLILTDYTIEPCLLGFAKRFNNPPVVGISAYSIPPFTYDFIGGFRHPSFVPHIVSTFDNDMTFLERVHNFLIYTYDDWYRHSRHLPVQEKLMRAAFTDPELDVHHLRRQINLVITNTHFSIEKLDPLPPNIIPCAGLQISKPKGLGADLKAFMDGAKDGVVLFSLGTNVRSEFLDSNTKQAFIDAFKSFPTYRFVWKYESELDLELPDNVKIQAWVRQNDILAYPKTRAFISHCGLLGTQEAAWYGVPILGIPFFADQFRNIRVGIREGTSIKISHTSMNLRTIKEALTTILMNPKFLANARRQSRIFRDQPDLPIDRAAFWIEWAIRHKDDYGTIQLPIQDKSVLVLTGIDVLAFLVCSAAAVVGVAGLIVYRCLKSQNSSERKVKRH